MTDEKIKEEFEKWKVNLLTVKSEERFADFTKCKDKDRSCVIGFYAGFRSAERLAKIEVLEETRKNLIKTFNQRQGDRFLSGRQHENDMVIMYLDNMLFKLKAGQ